MTPTKTKPIVIDDIIELHINLRGKEAEDFRRYRATEYGNDKMVNSTIVRKALRELIAKFNAETT